jgi:hypothetical protein
VHRQGLAGGGAALLAEFELQLRDGRHDAGYGTPRWSACVHPFAQRPYVNTATAQLVQGSCDFPNGPSEPVHGYDDRVFPW